MVIVSYSPQLQHAVNQLRRMDELEKVNLFKDDRWIQNFLLSESESNTIKLLFSQKPSRYKETKRGPYWNQIK